MNLASLERRLRIKKKIKERNIRFIRDFLSSFTFYSSSASSFSSASASSSTSSAFPASS